MKSYKVALDGLHLSEAVEIELRLSGGVGGAPALGELYVGADVGPL